MSKKLWSKRILNSKPYVAGEQPKENTYIKLNSNENPYPPSENVINAIQNADKLDLRKYPDNEYTLLRKTLAEKYRVTPEQIFVGNGSDEVLAFIFLAFFDATVLFPDITYSFYKVYASFFQVPYTEIPLDSNYDIQIKDYNIPNGGIIIANPNAPTGKAIPVSKIREILDNNPESLVVIDEAYTDFCDKSAVNLVNEYDNLLVVQTFSKSKALAGLRIGYAIGNPDLIDALNVVKNSINSYTLDSIAQVAAIAALQDENYYKSITQNIIKTRVAATARLINLGFTVLESSANFVFASHPKISAFNLYTELKARKILVRYFNQERIDNFLRITIGTTEEMEKLYEAIFEIIQKVQ